MKFLLLLPLISFILSCHLENQTETSETANKLQYAPVTLDSTIQLKAQGSYTKVKSSALELRTNKASGKEFEEHLLNSVIPHWYGTEWDFNGYTDTPNNGVIACGYFVSTTLLHMGINLNRYHLAQQAGLNEAKSLAIIDSNYFTVYGFENLSSEMDLYDDGIYFVGLDNHVGYLLKRSGQLYLIHSNYIDDKVMIETADESAAFESNIYVVAEISTNETLMEYWHANKVVKIYR